MRWIPTYTSQNDSLSFDAASVAVKNHQTGGIERVDLPMRASAGGFYANLNRMYHHFGIPIHPVRFLFVFAKGLRPNLDTTAPQPAPSCPSEAAAAVPGGYFIHASNHHQLRPPRPSSYGLLRYLLEVAFLIVCHFWFTACCFLVRPVPTENFSSYLDRIWIPRRYITHYILPLLSSVNTCTHTQLLTFPAGDLVSYITKSYNQPHYSVCGGVRQVQKRLAQGIEDVRTQCRVMGIALDPDSSRPVVWWRAADGEVHNEVFDRVVLAVSPDVAARIFPRLQAVLARIPTTTVETSVVVAPGDPEGRYSVVSEEEEDKEGAALGCMHHGGAAVDAESAPAQVITLRTQFSGKTTRTEAVHALPSGVVVQTCPLDAAGGELKRTLKAAEFTRALRTPRSRAIVEALMGRGNFDVGWVNGQDNVWLAGSWCWDGLVLLEGCIVSAMRIAEDFGVTVPWEAKEWQ